MLTVYRVEVFNAHPHKSGRDFRRGDQGGHGKSIPHRFANRHKVRHHSLLLKGPVMRADPAEARLHFIRQAETAGRTDRPEKKKILSAKIFHQNTAENGLEWFKPPKHGRKRFGMVQTTKTRPKTVKNCSNALIDRFEIAIRQENLARAALQWLGQEEAHTPPGQG